MDLSLVLLGGLLEGFLWISFQQLWLLKSAKGQLNSEWIYEVIVSPKIPSNYYRDFCPTRLLEGREEICGIIGILGETMTS